VIYNNNNNNNNNNSNNNKKQNGIIHKMNYFLYFSNRMRGFPVHALNRIGIFNVNIVTEQRI